MLSRTGSKNNKRVGGSRKECWGKQRMEKREERENKYEARRHKRRKATRKTHSEAYTREPREPSPDRIVHARNNYCPPRNSTLINSVDFSLY